MNNRLSLNKTQLQIIAIVAMVIDHIAWAFLDFWTPAAQALHVIGRLTIPIMCFFIAEGYRKTHNLRRYTDRLVTFALISILPFYMFFHEEYGFRQNIMFDHLLSLLMLMVLEHKRLNKWLKVLLVILIFAVSMTIAGWPITPQLFTLAFYYGKTFKDKVKWFVIADLSTVIFIAAFAVLNGIYHFAPYDWTWYNRFYLLGFLLALPIIKLYNGQKGGTRYGRFFFYIFYPIHLLVLAFIKYLASGNVSKHDIYLGFHVICLAIIFIMLAGIRHLRDASSRHTVDSEQSDCSSLKIKKGLRPFLFIPVNLPFKCNTSRQK